MQNHIFQILKEPLLVKYALLSDSTLDFNNFVWFFVAPPLGMHYIEALKLHKVAAFASTCSTFTFSSHQLILKSLLWENTVALSYSHCFLIENSVVKEKLMKYEEVVEENDYWMDCESEGDLVKCLGEEEVIVWEVCWVLEHFYERVVVSYWK